MGWNAPSLQILSVTPSAPVVATHPNFPVNPPATPPAPSSFSMKCSRVVDGTQLMFVLAKGDARLVHYEVVPCFAVVTKGHPDDQTATFKASFSQRAAGTYHLVAWASTKTNGEWDGLNESFVFENAVVVTRDPNAAEPS